jgi:uncharacterized damage-inducible protein DinB
MSVQLAHEREIENVLTQRWEQVSQKFADLAEALPAEKFDTAPVGGLRTCGAVVRHIAFWNRYVADSLAGRAANDADNELPVAAYPDKQSAMRELQRTSQAVASALRKHAGGSSAKTAELIMTFVEHTSEHYGQLAVYARLIGIVPPASRS